MNANRNMNTDMNMNRGTIYELARIDLAGGG